MSHINVCTFVGNLGSEPNERVKYNRDHVPSVRVLLAVDTGRFNKVAGVYEPETTWIPLQAWRTVAERLIKFGKGDKVVVTGSMRSERDWVDETGQSRKGSLFLAVDQIDGYRRAGSGENFAIVQSPAVSGDRARDIAEDYGEEP